LNVPFIDYTQTEELSTFIMKAPVGYT